MRESRFITEALRREGVDAQLAHHADRVNHLRQALSFVGYVARHTAYPDLCHLLTLSYLVNPMTGMRWRAYDMDGFPPAAKVSPLMRVWCDRLPRWSPEEAHDALLKVCPFGRRHGAGGARRLPVARTHVERSHAPPARRPVRGRRPRTKAVPWKEDVS